MPKKRKRHLRKAGLQHTSPEAHTGYVPGEAYTGPPTPSAATLFRSKHFDLQTYELVRRQLAKLKPILLERDRADVEKIEGAQTAEELLDLVGLASGLGEDAWFKRSRGFGKDFLPLIAGRLAQARLIPDQDLQDITYDTLVAELRWRGVAGAEILLESFDELSDYGKSQACVAIGLTGVPEASRQAAIDKIWDFYEQVDRDRHSRDFIGALWGLIDLKDEEVGGALWLYLLENATFFELYGFLSLAGDVRALLPLVSIASQSKRKAEMDDPMMALVSIAHRAGREALIETLAKAAPEDEPRAELEKLADGILAIPASDAREYFALFYRGFQPEEIEGLL